MKIHRILCLLVILLSSCSEKKTTSTTTLRIGTVSTPLTTDPRKTGDATSCMLSFMLYEGLTHLEQSGNVRLAAAQSVDISPDRKTYTFTLRDSLWSNGDAVSAEDFAFAWKSLLEPTFPSPVAYLFYPIKNARRAKEGECPISEVGVTAIDSKTLVVELERPTPYFLELISFCSFYPIYQKDPTALNHRNHKLIVNGPYTLENWQSLSTIYLKKNRSYWDRENISMEEIQMHIFESSLTAIQLFEKEKIDCLCDNMLSNDLLVHYHKQPELKKEPLSGLSFVTFNTTQPPFSNKNIREAFSYAIDRASIASNIGQHRPAGCLIPPSLCKEELTSNYFKSCSSKLAKEHLEKGLEELGLTLETFPSTYYLYFNGDIEKRIAQALQNQWREELGIELELLCLEFSTFLDTMYKKKFAIAQFGALAQYFDAMNILERFAFPNEPKNYSSWENRKYQTLLENALVEANLSDRLALYHQAEAILMQELPICPLLFFEKIYLQQKELEGIYVNPIGAFDFRSAKVINR